MGFFLFERLVILTFVCFKRLLTSVESACNAFLELFENDEKMMENPSENVCAIKELGVE